ncbi:hypothetical protein CCP3SC15_430002 [Gammaproteobacteria bacterium]
MLLTSISRFLIPLLLLLFLPIAQAEETDLVLLVDDSGSMKQNDPQFFLRQVILSFADQINSDTHLALFSFNKEATLLLPLSTSSSSHTRINDALSRITYHGLHTDIADAVERAVYLLKNEGRARAAKAILLLTDGYMDTGNPLRDQDKTRWLLHELSEECVQNRVRLFGIAFTETADYQLLQSVAWRTHGDYFRVFDREGMYNAFHRIREQIAPPPIPMTAAIPPPVVTPGVTAAPTISDRPIPPTLPKPSPQSSSLNLPTPVEDSPPPPPIETTLRQEPPSPPSTTEEAPRKQIAAGQPPNTVFPTYPHPLPPIETETAHTPLNQPPPVTETKEADPTNNISAEGSESSHLWLWLISLFIIAILGVEARKHYPFTTQLATLRNWTKQWHDRFLPTEEPIPVQPPAAQPITHNFGESTDLLHQTIKFQLGSARSSKEEARKESEVPPHRPTFKPISSSILAKLVDHRGNQGIGEFPLTHAITLISRNENWELSNTAHLHIDAPTISRRHAVIEFRDFSFWLRDLGSTNGTYVNRQPVGKTEKKQLKDGDFVQFHTFGFDFVLLNHEEDNSTYQSGNEMEAGSETNFYS